jgi:DNA-binding PadR family transcriptional regulator
MTPPTRLVLRALLDDPTRELHGPQICESAGLPGGTIHSILARLENIGWLDSRWGEVEPSERGRPRRRYYRLNPNSIATVQAALARASGPSPSAARLRTGLAGGDR